MAENGNREIADVQARLRAVEADIQWTSDWRHKVYANEAQVVLNRLHAIELRLAAKTSAGDTVVKIATFAISIAALGIAWFR